MLITFAPSLGSATHVASSSLFPQPQTTPLLFTARLSALDHAQLLRDGGRVQLWTNLPRDGETDGGWREMEFEDACELSTARPAHASVYTRVSFRTSPPVPADDTNEDKTLYLAITLPPTNSPARQFSFTHRIVYPSGKITWLGAFGQNGSIVINELGLSNDSNGLSLHGNWSTDSFQGARVFESEEESQPVVVAKVQSPSDFRIRALGKDRIISDLTDASVLIFIPCSGRLLALSPSYVMAASPGLTLTVSTDGCVSASGVGTLQLRQCDALQEPGPFIEEVLRHSKLDNWDVVSSDAKSQAVVLACTGCDFPIPAVAFSLWPSEHTQSPISIDFSKFTGLFRNSDVKEFAIFSSQKSKMHIFNLQQTEVRKIEKVLLELDTNDDFTFAPIYRLPTHNFSPNKILRNWTAAILTHHKVVSAPIALRTISTLPTPPPSPPSHPIASFSQTLASSKSIDTIKTDKKNEEVSQEPSQPQGQKISNVGAVAIPLTVMRLQRLPLRSCMGWFFRYFFASIRFLFRFFFRLVWGPGSASSAQLNQEDRRLALHDEPSAVISTDHDLPDEEDNVDIDAEGRPVDQERERPSSSRVSEQSRAAALASSIEGTKGEDASTKSGETDPASVPDLVFLEPARGPVGPVPVKTDSTRLTILDAASCPPHRTESEEDIFHAEVSPLGSWHAPRSGDDDAMAPKTRSVMVEIVLLPLAMAAVNLGRNQIDQKNNSGDDSRHDATLKSLAALTSSSLQKAVDILDESTPMPAAAVGSVEAHSCWAIQDVEFSQEGKNETERQLDQARDEYAAFGYILRYLVSWDDLKKGKVFTIRAPVAE